MVDFDIGERFTATDKLGNKFAYELMGIDPNGGDRAIILYNLDQRGETRVEPEWLNQRKIKRIPADDRSKMSVKYYDIDETAARRAKEANSYNTYPPLRATIDYRASVDKAAEIAEQQKARVDPMYHERIDKLLDTYARKLAENMNKSNEIDARVPSVMIAGPANFPNAKKEKQNAARARNLEDWRHIQGLLDKIQSTGRGGISADDPAAIDKLKAQLKSLEDGHLTRKAVNAYYRKYNTLDGCPHLSEENIRKLQASMSNPSWGRQTQPFPAWALSNNNANMKRIRDRIAELERRAEKPPAGWAFDGGEVVVNTDENRLQVLFDEKPDDAMRQELKRSGFRWAPSQGAWQRQLTDNALYAAKRINFLQPAEKVPEKSIKETLAYYSQQIAKNPASPSAPSKPSHGERG